MNDRNKIAVVIERADMFEGTVDNLIWLENAVREIKFQPALVSVQVDKVTFWF